MNQADEDALVEKMADSLCDWKPQTDLFVICREAIRAAVAQERERAAKVAESVACTYRAHSKTAKDCAAAIRRGV